MPVFEQGYRRWEGELKRGSPILPMAWQTIRTRLRWWVWVLLALLLFYPYVVWGVTVFTVTLGADMFGGSQIGRTIPMEAFAMKGPNPGLVISLVTTGSPALFWEIMKASALANAVLPAVACGGILSSDRMTGAMQIYFSRPVTRLQYLSSKVIAVASFSALVTFVPTMLIWLECVAFSKDSAYLLNTWHVPFVILAGSAFYAFWATGLVLALSAVLKRAVMTRIAAIAVYLAAAGVGHATADAARNESWKIIDPLHALGGITAPLFGLDLPEWLDTPWLIFAGAGVPLILLAFVWTRVKAVEVST